jgi:hypothetical protein
MGNPDCILLRGQWLWPDADHHALTTTEGEGFN